MASTVKVPIFGTVNKGTAVGVSLGGLAVAGYLIARQVKKSKAQTAAASTAASTAASASAGYGYGYGYGAGGTGVYPGGYYGYGEYGYGASGGFEPTGYYGYGVTEPQPVANTTNAQWAQAAINQLTGEGYSAQTVSSALGAYELGQPVQASQVSIVQAAIGIEGYPPVPGANGYPPAINTQGTPGGGSGGGQTGTTTVKVPNVKGQRGEVAKANIEKAGLTAEQSPSTTPKGKTTTVTSTSPAAGTSVKSGSTVTVKLKVS